MVKTLSDMRIQLIAKRDATPTGLSRYTMDIYRALKSSGNDIDLTFPASLPLPKLMQDGLKRVGVDSAAFFGSYPLRARSDGADVYHLTSQTLATLLLFQRLPKPIVVTVHDIIPFLVWRIPVLNTFRSPMDHLFYRLALAGLRRADAIVAVSEFTKRTLIDHLQLCKERIHVVHSATDHEVFRVMPVSDSFLARHGLDKSQQYVLYVGSEDPRKNLQTLVSAFALVRKRVGKVKMLKVGAPHFAMERQRLEASVERLGLRGDVLFFDHVSDEDLSSFYNLASVFVMPSLYEGFGLPVLESEACGTPVVCANSGSLPEICGGAGLLFENGPYAVEALADAVVRILTEPGLHEILRAQGLANAASFHWSKSAHQLLEIYRNEAITPGKSRKGARERVMDQ